MKSIFSLSRRPWLFSFLILFFWITCNILVINKLSWIFQLEDPTQVQAPWPTFLANLLIVFIVAPFVLGFPDLSRVPYRNPPHQDATTTRFDPVGVVLLLDHRSIAGRGCAGISFDGRFAG